MTNGSQKGLYRMAAVTVICTEDPIKTNKACLWGYKTQSSDAKALFLLEQTTILLLFRCRNKILNFFLSPVRYFHELK